MVTVDDSHEKALAKWSPMLFLIGGVFQIGHALIMSMKAFTEIATPPEIFASVGQLLVFAGLLGVYFTLVDETPRLVRAGGLCVALGVAGFTAITVGTLAEFGGIDPPGWFGVFTLFGIVGIVPGFFLFGAATLRADAHSRTVGLLLIAPALVFLALIATVLIFGTSPPTGLVMGSGLALTYLAIGYSLRPEFALADDPTSVGDATAS